MSETETETENEDQGELPELCDWCGTTVSREEEFGAFVPDSSVTHSHDPRLDGQRLVTACSRQHLDALVEQYKRRPFIYAELWAGKVYRAMQEHPEGVSPDDLASETGLTPVQIELGMLWQNLGAAIWHERFGKNADPGTGG